MILIALGGADCVWEDLSNAVKLLEKRPYDIGGVNEVGMKYDGHLTLWCSLHPDKLALWQQRREDAGLNTDYCSVAHKGSVGRRFNNGRTDAIVKQAFPGCSGLYLTQVAALLKSYDKVICCGMPNAATPHFFDSKPWADYERYRRGWKLALEHPLMQERVRSMSGWTSELFGRPNETWLDGTA